VAGDFEASVLHPRENLIVLEGDTPGLAGAQGALQRNHRIFHPGKLRLNRGATGCRILRRYVLDRYIHNITIAKLRISSDVMGVSQDPYGIKMGDQLRVRCGESRKQAASIGGFVYVKHIAALADQVSGLVVINQADLHGGYLLRFK